MRLTDFPVPKNKSKRGIHGSASCYPEEGHWRARLSLCKDMGLGWYKFLDDGGGSGINVYRAAYHEFGLMPIIRFYQSAPGKVGPREADAIKRILDTVGVPVYFQICNEPDLPIEWPEREHRKQPKDWLQRSIDAYCQYAPVIIDLGGLPGTFSLASGAFGQVRVDEAGNVIDPVKYNYLKAIHQKNPEILGRGGWVAMHNYTLNHPLDYPYDDVNKFGTPLTQAEYDAAPSWAWDNRPMAAINAQRDRDKNGPGVSIWTDDSCFNAYMVFLAMLEELGLTEVPVITAEGGPCMTDGPDGRYVKIHQKLHADMVEGIYRRIGPIRQYLTYSHWLFYNTTGGWGTNCWLDGSQDHSQTINRLKGAPIGAWGEVINFDAEPQPPGPLPPGPLPPEPKPPIEPEPEVEWLIPSWNEARHGVFVYMPGETVWKLVKAELSPDNMANTVWVNVYDEKGQRVNAPVMVQNVNGNVEQLPYKPGEAYNRPMWKNDRLKVWIGQDGSDTVSNIHGAYWGIPGVNAYHVGYVLTFKKWVAGEDEDEPEPPPDSIEYKIRNKAWNSLYPGVIPYNPDAAFPKMAREYMLGVPTTLEVDVDGHRLQGYANGILYCVIGDWGNIKEIDW